MEKANKSAKKHLRFDDYWIHNQVLETKEHQWTFRRREMLWTHCEKGKIEELIYFDHQKVIYFALSSVTSAARAIEQ